MFVTYSVSQSATRSLGHLIQQSQAGERASVIRDFFLSLTKSPISARCHFPHHERGREGHKEREGESPNQFRRRRGNLSSAIPAVRPYFSLLRVSFSAKAKAKTNETSRPTGSIDSLSLPQFGFSYSILNPRSPFMELVGVNCQQYFFFWITP